MLPSLLSGEEMTVREPFFCPSAADFCPIVSFRRVRYTAARVFKKVAVLTRLFAITPRPTHRAVPSAP
jgi:hypothetical protein